MRDYTELYILYEGNKHMKKRIFICIAVICALVVILAVNKINEKKYIYKVEKVENPEYLLLMENNRYGVVDVSGNVIIDPIYDIVEIPNPSKDVFICKKDYNSSKGEYNVQVLNREKQNILYQYYIVEAIELNGVEDNGYYEKSILKYKSNGLYGLIDLSGNKITKPIYESIEGFELNEGLLLTKKSGKYGIINMNGATVIKNKYDEIISDKYYDEKDGYANSGYIVGIKTDQGIRYGYIDSNRNMLLKNEYNDIYRIEDKNDSIYLIAFKNGKAGIYNKKKNILAHEYEDIEYNADNDLLMIQKASKQGVARFDGTIIVPLEYDNILFAGSYINAKNGDKVCIFDSNGNKEHNEDYISKQDFCDKKYAIVSTVDNIYKIIVNKSGKVIDNNFSYAQYLFNNYFIVQQDGKFGIIDDEGTFMVACEYEVIQPTLEYNIIQLLSKNGKIAIRNTKLEEIVKSSKITISKYLDYLKIDDGTEIKYISKQGEIEDKPDCKSAKEPEQVGQYHKVDLGYGYKYYTK